MNTRQFVFNGVPRSLGAELLVFISLVLGFMANRKNAAGKKRPHSPFCCKLLEKLRDSGHVEEGAPIVKNTEELLGLLFAILPTTPWLIFRSCFCHHGG